jgi:hypothetical protein
VAVSLLADNQLEVFMDMIPDDCGQLSGTFLPFRKALTK